MFLGLIGNIRSVDNSYITHGSHEILRVHTLTGNKYPLQSMNITGDYRALFIATKTKITFYEIGTHSELYE